MTRPGTDQPAGAGACPHSERCCPEDHDRVPAPRRTSRAVSTISDGQPGLPRHGEVATRFRVDPKTVTRWAKQGLLERRCWSGPASGGLITAQVTAVLTAGAADDTP